MHAVYKEARATLLLAIPIAIGQVSQMLMGVTDSVMIGRTGTVPLAASSFGGSVFNVFFIIGIGLMAPVAIFASRSKGAGRHDEAGQYLRHGLLLGGVSGLLEVLLIIYLGFHLEWFRQSPAVLNSANPFFLLIGFSLLPALAYLALRQFAEAMGHPWLPVVIILVCVGLNAFLNWVFIYGHLGVPSLGLTGAGIATLLSRLLSSAVLFSWLRRDPALRAAWPRRWLAPFSWTMMRRMLAVGLPASGGLLFEGGAFGATTVMMGWLGAVPLAAHQIALSCAAMTFMPPLGIAIAVGVRTSGAVGLGELGRLRPIWIGGAAMGAAVAVLVTVGMLLFGRQIASGFIDDGAVVSTATVLLGVAAIFQIFDGAQVINSAALRGITDVRIPALITFIAYWLIALPLGYFLGIHSGFGPVGIWSGLAVGLATASTLLGFRFVRLTRAQASGA